MAAVRKNRSKSCVLDYYDIYGNRIRKTYYSLNAARKEADKIESQKKLLRFGITDTDAPFKAVVEYYFNTRPIAQSTKIREMQVFENLSFLNNLMLSEITSEILDTYFNSRKNIKPNTRMTEYRILNAFFSFCIKEGLLEENPLSNVEKPKTDTKTVRYLTIKEVQNLLSVIRNHDDLDYFTVMLFTGARRAELLRDTFKWKNVNFDERTLTILGKGTKERILPMNDTVYKILFRRKNLEYKEYPFELDYRQTAYRLNKYYKKANIHNANVHTLRKTFGSLLLHTDTPILEVSRLMGHASIKVTEKHYAGYSEKTARRAVQRLDDLLSN
jgi:integrase/recombinase XerC